MTERGVMGLRPFQFGTNQECRFRACMVSNTFVTQRSTWPDPRICDTARTVGAKYRQFKRDKRRNTKRIACIKCILKVPSLPCTFIAMNLSFSQSRMPPLRPPIPISMTMTMPPVLPKVTSIQTDTVVNSLLGS